MRYEYKVVPAPERGIKAKGLKTTQDRFAHALETAINDLAADGWAYVRADTLPCEQREGLMGKTTVFQNLLVFQREKPDAPKAAPVAPAKEQTPPPPAIAEPAPDPAPSVEDNTTTAPTLTDSDDTPRVRRRIISKTPVRGKDDQAD